MKIPMTPWVKAAADTLVKWGEPVVTMIGIALGVATLAFMIFGSFWTKAVAVAYLLTP